MLINFPPIQLKGLISDVFATYMYTVQCTQRRAIIYIYTISSVSVPVQFLIEVRCTHLPSIRRALQLLKVLQSLKKKVYKEVRYS